MHRIRRHENIEQLQDRPGNGLGKDRILAVRLRAHVPQNVVHPFEDQTWRVLGRFVKASMTPLLNHFPLSDNVMKFSYERAAFDRAGSFVDFIFPRKGHSFHCGRPLTWFFRGAFLRGGRRTAFDHETLVCQFCAVIGGGESRLANEVWHQGRVQTVLRRLLRTSRVRAICRRPLPL